jgi:hypothetical protein
VYRMSEFSVLNQSECWLALIKTLSYFLTANKTTRILHWVGCLALTSKPRNEE